MKDRTKANAYAREWRARNRDKHNAYSRELKRRNPEYAVRQREASRAATYRKKYGIEIAEYDDRYTTQGGMCALCARPSPSGRRLAVDHDHTTGRVRGLLCLRCNQALGTFGDSVAGVSRVIRYLEEHASV